ncbi:PQQ-dependent sugar dehydrogenase [Hydrogenophaga palleronii]|uniref:PQQ-dependent sugar dehydrogenase n=1 Tax=Hydrogenophaga palleronii TaxID=65655 RepID=UPI000825AF4A|nr:PQQ-dependent sugar dehydrogenase [Hydrogenophaga palleronii]
MRTTALQALGSTLAAATLLLPAGATAAELLYATRGSCAGHPGIALSVPTGWCAGLVADARDGLRMPRRLLEIAPGRFWIVDMGNWEPRRGRLLELRTDIAAGQPGRVRVLASGLDRPHGLARGPDDRIYIGEAGGVWRTPIGDHVQRENVITGLPADGAHPLKELAFTPVGRLLVNLGSVTDACRGDDQQQPRPCPEITGPQPRAAVYEARFGAAPAFALQSFKPLATGLRNSLGLASTTARDGTHRLWQAENSVDYRDTRLPAEELNELREGASYGWPYCLSDARGNAVPARGYENRARCSEHVAPHAAWPAHVAPLQLLVAPNTLDTESPFAGRLLAVWHGYRASGQRIVAWRLDKQGQPTGPREDVVSGWQVQAGVRPLGAPAGATFDSQGRLWIVEDRNRSLIVVAPAPSPSPSPATAQP